MTDIVFTDGFLHDMEAVESDRKIEEIFDRISLLESSPEIGSSLLPKSIVRRFGSRVRKLMVSPFDIIYEFLPETDTVVVLQLIHQRAIR